MLQRELGNGSRVFSDVSMNLNKFNFCDCCNRYVIQLMVMIVLEIIRRHGMEEVELTDTHIKRYSRYAAIQERLISPEAIGSSIAYRFGAFQSLSDVVYRKLLPNNVSEHQVRSALAAVIKRQISAPNTFDDMGWLRIGFYGSQSHWGETYISTGSLYLSCAVFIVLGLPVEDSFWSSKEELWTSLKVYKGLDMKADKSIQN